MSLDPTYVLSPMLETKCQAELLIAWHELARGALGRAAEPIEQHIKGFRHTRRHADSRQRSDADDPGNVRRHGASAREFPL